MSIKSGEESLSLISTMMLGMRHGLRTHREAVVCANHSSCQFAARTFNSALRLFCSFREVRVGFCWLPRLLSGREREETDHGNTGPAANSLNFLLNL